MPPSSSNLLCVLRPPSVSLWCRSLSEAARVSPQSGFGKGTGTTEAQREHKEHREKQMNRWQKHASFFFQSSLCSPSSLGVSVVPFPLRSRASLTSERFRKGDRDHRGTERAQRAQRKADESMAKACLLLLPIFSVFSV